MTLVRLFLSFRKSHASDSQRQMASVLRMFESSLHIVGNPLLLHLTLSHLIFFSVPMQISLLKFLLMLIHDSRLYKENIERIAISIALSHCVILNMICRLMQMPMEITLLNPLNDPEHRSLSHSPRTESKHSQSHTHTHTPTHTYTRRAQISTQGNIEGKVYNELAIESSGSSGSSYSDCVLCVIGNLNKLKLFRTHSAQLASTHTHTHS